jgi:transcriptional regulator with XRE-family HTH domain
LISAIEIGTANPALNSLERLATALKIDFAALFDRATRRHLSIEAASSIVAPIFPCEKHSGVRLIEFKKSARESDRADLRRRIFIRAVLRHEINELSKLQRRLQEELDE